VNSDHDLWARELRAALRPRTDAEQLVARRLRRIADIIVRSGRLWHTTSEERFRSILSAGAILPEPPLPDADRWSTACGPAGYPLVRHLGGVSLFDLRGFPGWDAYKERYPSSSIRSFVPIRDGWNSAVWIEIDREAVSPGFLSVEAVRREWSSQMQRRFMPMIEAAHLGPVPVGAFRRCILVSRGDGPICRLRT